MKNSFKTLGPTGGKGTELKVEDLNSNPISVICWLCDLRQVTQPLWACFITCEMKRLERRYLQVLQL